MPHVKQFIHCLMAKWMLQIANSQEESWTFHAWSQLTQVVPGAVIPGMRTLLDLSKACLDPFYKQVLTSFVLLNDKIIGLSGSEIPRNLWSVHCNLRINKAFVMVGYVQVSDLPLLEGSVDWKLVQANLWSQKGGTFMVCAALQCIF